MPAKINRSVVINGVRKWIRANSEQEYAEKLMKISTAGMEKIQAPKLHIFGEYAENWFEVYSLPNIEKATAATYRRQLTLYLIPAFGEKAVEDITTDDIQGLFNSMSGTKATKQKARMVLNMILEAAVEDGLLPRNPLKSRRLKITGEASKVTKEYTVEQMRFLIRNLKSVKKATDRAYLAIQALHPLRLEEVLGLKWADIDLESMTLSVRRAVTHPTRNQPEVKATKTEASARVIGLSAIAAEYLEPGEADEFVFGGENPYTYHKVRRMCERIKRDTGFDGEYYPDSLPNNRPDGYLRPDQGRKNGAGGGRPCLPDHDHAPIRQGARHCEAIQRRHRPYLRLRLTNVCTPFAHPEVPEMA